VKRIQIFESVLLAIALSSFAMPDTQAATYTVNTSSDSVAANACENHLSGCSLRGAIQAANAHSGDTIVFHIIEFCPISGCVITLSSALPDISAPMSISGPSSHAIQRGSSAATNFRIFNVTTTGTVNISNLVIKKGNPGGANGGGLQNFNGGTVNVTNCLFQDNVANNGGGISGRAGTVNVTGCTFVGNLASNGGGIYNDGALIHVTNCTFTGNTAGGDGGGFANDHYRTATISNSTFTGNTANQGDPNASGGGAISNGDHDHSFGGFLTITNTTISGNTALRGGGVSTAGGAAAGELTVTHCTIVGNSSFYSDSGGGITKDGQGVSVKIKNTIVALNTGSAGRDVFGDFTSSGFNLIGRIDGSTGITAATDQTGTIASPLDPKLDPAGLQSNGGPTQTIALLGDSPAIDKGSSNGLTGALTTDQRGSGFNRTFDYPFIANAVGGDGTDIGALESLQPYSASRKMQGATPFDIVNPLAGLTAIECRSGGATGDFQLIMTFASPITVNGNPQAQVTSGTGMIGSGGVSNGGVVTVNGAVVTVPLTSVANAQTIGVTLFAVNDGLGPHNVSTQFSFLLGDTSGNGSVNASDVSQTKLQSGQTLTATNFRADVNASGTITSTDISSVKLRTGTALP
jgi:CSLREA domain-containing protein